MHCMECGILLPQHAIHCPACGTPAPSELFLVYNPDQQPGNKSRQKKTLLKTIEQPPNTPAKPAEVKVDPQLPANPKPQRPGTQAPKTPAPSELFGEQASYAFTEHQIIQMETGYGIPAPKRYQPRTPVSQTASMPEALPGTPNPHSDYTGFSLKKLGKKLWHFLVSEEQPAQWHPERLAYSERENRSK